MTARCLEWSDSKLVERDDQGTRAFDFDDGREQLSCFPVTLPDLMTIPKSTGGV
jgi:hypothetical protein